MKKDTWCVEIWGSRGSFPRPEARFLKYGGNTSCVSLTHGGGVVILDAGSGLAKLGQRLCAGRLDIFISHFHLDHVQGLPMFQPFYNPETEVHIYGQAGLKQSLETLVGSPYWPVGFSDFAAKISFHELRPGTEFVLNGLKVTTMGGNHPGGSILYRMDGMDSDGRKRSLVYALDCEADEKVMQDLAGFAREADLLLWDAGFTSEDFKAGWGHSTWEQGMALRRLAGAKKVVMMHYNGAYDDTFLEKLEERARGQDAAVWFAREGMRLC